MNRAKAADPTSQDTVIAVQDTIIAVQDTLIVVPDTLIAVPDTLNALPDTIRTDGRRPPAPPQATTTQEETYVYKDSARLAIEQLTRTAWRRSLIVPGWGQITNGGIWWIKVPIFYAGYVTAGLVFEFNNRYYNSILKDVQYRLANNNAYPPDSPYDYIGADQQGTQYLISAKDYYRRNRDLSILAFVGWHALNAIEAYVDSMLKNRWDIGPQLAFDVHPALLPINPQVPGLALGMTLSLKIGH